MLSFSNSLNILFICSIDLTPEEGGGSVDLMSNGREIEVNATNVYDYVRKYAKYKMIKTQEKAIEVSWFVYKG